MGNGNVGEFVKHCESSYMFGNHIGKESGILPSIHNCAKK